MVSSKEFMKEVVGQPATAVSKLASARWKALGEDEKKVYQDRYEAVKAKYDSDMKSFLDAGGEVTRKQKRETKETQRRHACNYIHKLSIY